MKKLYNVLTALVAVTAMWACGPAEVGFTQEFDLQGLYTVNKATVAPEFSDTMFFIRNMENFDLKTGDRVMLLLHYNYDAYSGVDGQWKIVEVLKKFPTHPLSSLSDIDTSAYKTLVTGLQPLNFFNKFEAKSWIWKNWQNICIKYNGVEEGASFAMAVRGVDEKGCVVLQLFVDAKESEKETATLLTFDISNITDFLTDEQKALLPEGKDIETTIILKRSQGGEPVNWPEKGNNIVYY